MVFARKNALKVHEIKHKQVKPFVCLVQSCSRGFTEKGTLVKHLKNFHSLKVQRTKVYSSDSKLIGKIESQ